MYYKQLASYLPITMVQWF